MNRNLHKSEKLYWKYTLSKRYEKGAAITIITSSTLSTRVIKVKMNVSRIGVVNRGLAKPRMSNPSDTNAPASPSSVVLPRGNRERRVDTARPTRKGKN